jgi:hypothetical protein
MTDLTEEKTHRVLILDNDETTGSYYILFSLYDLLALSHFGDKLDSQKTLESLCRSCEEFGVFRPGLRTFLKEIEEMKQNGLVEKLCLYTNQLDVRDVYHHPHWKTRDGITWSVPLMISKMFNIMAENDKFVDELYTRPIGKLKQVNNYPVKDLARVFSDLYPKEKVNLERTMFVDDLHHRKYIIDSSNSKTDKASRCPIPAYSRQLPKDAFGTIVDRILRIHGLELHWHNSILRDSIESGWIHLNSGLRNLHTGRSVLQKTMDRIRQFFNWERKEKLGGLNKKRIRDGHGSKRDSKSKTTTRAKGRTKGSKRNKKTKSKTKRSENTDTSKRERRTRKGRNPSS